MSQLIVDFITSLDGYASAEGWRGPARMTGEAPMLRRHGIACTIFIRA